MIKPILCTYFSHSYILTIFIDFKWQGSVLKQLDMYPTGKQTSLEMWSMPMADSFRQLAVQIPPGARFWQRLVKWEAVCVSLLTRPSLTNNNAGKQREEMATPPESHSGECFSDSRRMWRRDRLAKSNEGTLCPNGVVCLLCEWPTLTWFYEDYMGSSVSHMLWVWPAVFFLNGLVWMSTMDFVEGWCVSRLTVVIVLIHCTYFGSWMLIRGLKKYTCVRLD